MRVHLRRVETRQTHAFGVVFGIDERLRSVYALEPAWQCRQWAALLELGVAVEVSLPSNRVSLLRSDVPGDGTSSMAPQGAVPPSLGANFRG